jgi:hypothetical protein
MLTRRVLLRAMLVAVLSPLTQLLPRVRTEHEEWPGYIRLWSECSYQLTGSNPILPIYQNGAWYNVPLRAVGGSDRIGHLDVMQWLESNAAQGTAPGVYIMPPRPYNPLPPPPLPARRV